MSESPTRPTPTLALASCLLFWVQIPSRNCICARVLMQFSGCWASAGYSAQGCAALEQQLRTCMDAPVRIHPFFRATTYTQAPICRHQGTFNMLRLSRRKHNKTRRAPSTTTSRDCTRKSWVLTNESEPSTNTVHSFYQHIACYPVACTQSDAWPDALRGVWGIHGYAPGRLRRSIDL